MVSYSKNLHTHTLNLPACAVVLCDIRLFMRKFETDYQLQAETAAEHVLYYACVSLVDVFVCVVGRVFYMRWVRTGGYL